MKYTIIILLIIVGMADGVKDATNFHPKSFNKYNLDVSFWNNSVVCDGGEVKLKSWKNKYKIQNGKLMPYLNKWYHIGKKPKYAEKFPFSTTLFVFVTDGFHLMKAIQMWVLCLIISLYNVNDFCFIEKKCTLFNIIKVVSFVLAIRLLIGVGFYLSYNLIL